MLFLPCDLEALLFKSLGLCSLPSSMGGLVALVEAEPYDSRVWDIKNNTTSCFS